MSGVRRNKKLYSVNTRNKQVYILIEILRKHPQHCISKDDGAGPQNAKSNAPLRVDSSGTRMFGWGCVCVRREEGEKGCHGPKKREWEGIKNLFKVYSLHPIGKA